MSSIAHPDGSLSTPDQRTGQGLTRPAPTYFGGLHHPPAVVDTPRSNSSWSDLEAQKPMASIYPEAMDRSPPKSLCRKRCERGAMVLVALLIGAAILCTCLLATGRIPS